MDQAQNLSVLGLPDSLLLKVFTSLPLKSLRCVSLTCSRFSRIALDQQLWKTMFQRDFKVPQSVPLRPKASSWRAEYRRLYDESPAVLCEQVLGHKDEVWHVSFSHNGEMFATCSKDGLVKVWEATTPCKLRFVADMETRLDWHSTQYSQFNESDKLLLVTGVVDDFKGEVVIFDLNQDLKLLRRILNRPFTVFGTWFDDHHVLSGTLRPTDFIASVWLAKQMRKNKCSSMRYGFRLPAHTTKKQNIGRAVRWLLALSGGETQAPVIYVTAIYVTVMYLYVNTRRWTEDYVVGDKTEPPIADEVDIHIISLMTFTQVDTVLRSHKAFIPNQDFPLFLNLTELYVASGSGDNRGYMWDRHYGVHVRCFPHYNVVNSCAFNPIDPEMLVTVSDDFKMNIWRSRRQMREIREMKKVYKYETATPATVADENCLEGRDNSDTLSG